MISWLLRNNTYNIIACRVALGYGYITVTYMEEMANQ